MSVFALSRSTGQVGTSAASRACLGILAFILVSAVLPQLLTAQQPDECKNKRAQAAWVTSPVYNDANEVALKLTQNGFLVECIRRSKQEHLFDGQKGAAWFSTNRGKFEVWFLQEDETFASLEINEQPQPDGRYTYTFRGTPQIPTPIDSAKRLYFIKRGRLMFEVWGDSQLAASLERALTAP
jgi:hypothetical protein